MTELDAKLQEIAVKDWDRFVQMIGLDRVTAAKVCLLRQSGDSYGKISVKLRITYRQAEHGCKQCEKSAQGTVTIR